MKKLIPLVLVALTISVPAHATILKFDFAGSILKTSDSTTLGNSVSGSFLLDTSYIAPSSFHFSDFNSVGYDVLSHFHFSNGISNFFLSVDGVATHNAFDSMYASSDLMNYSATGGIYNSYHSIAFSSDSGFAMNDGYRSGALTYDDFLNSPDPIADFYLDGFHSLGTFAYYDNGAHYNGQLKTTSVSAVSVFEPTSLALFGLGLAGLGLTRRAKTA